MNGGKGRLERCQEISHLSSRGGFVRMRRSFTFNSKIAWIKTPSEIGLKEFWCRRTTITIIVRYLWKRYPRIKRHINYLLIELTVPFKLLTHSLPLFWRWISVWSWRLLKWQRQHRNIFSTWNNARTLCYFRQMRELQSRNAVTKSPLYNQQKR